MARQNATDPESVDALKLYASRALPRPVQRTRWAIMVLGVPTTVNWR